MNNIKNRKVIIVINDENTPHPNFHKVLKGKKVKELIKNKKSKNQIIDQIAAKGNLFKQGKLTRIQRQVNSGIPTYFYRLST